MSVVDLTGRDDLDRSLEIQALERAYRKVEPLVKPIIHDHSLS